jgi:hypothetical protein
MTMRGNFSIACDTLTSGDGTDYLVGDTAILIANTANTSIPASTTITSLQTFASVWLFCYYKCTPHQASWMLHCGRESCN